MQNCPITVAFAFDYLGIQPNLVEFLNLIEDIQEHLAAVFVKHRRSHTVPDGF